MSCLTRGSVEISFLCSLPLRALQSGSSRSQSLLRAVQELPPQFELIRNLGIWERGLAGAASASAAIGSFLKWNILRSYFSAAPFLRILHLPNPRKIILQEDFSSLCLLYRSSRPCPILTSLVVSAWLLSPHGCPRPSCFSPLKFLRFFCSSEPD